MRIWRKMSFWLSVAAAAAALGCADAAAGAAEIAREPDFSIMRTFDDAEGEPLTRDSVALAERFWNGGEPIARGYKPRAGCCEDGSIRTFRMPRSGSPARDAELLFSTESALWYMEMGASASVRDLRAAAARFENEIAPAIRRLIGDAWTPGIDGDERFIMLHAPLGGEGFFGYADEYPRAAFSDSNEAEILYVGVRPGSPDYAPAAARLLARAALWNLDEGEDAWARAAMEDAALMRMGYLPRSSDWDLGAPIAHQGRADDRDRARAAAFALFVADRAGGLGAVARQGADGLRGFDAALLERGETLEDVFLDFISERIVAGNARFGETIASDYSEYAEIARSGARLYGIEGAGDIEIEIARAASMPAISRICGEGCWQSPPDDWAHSYLEREIDLTAGAPYELRFKSWTALEPGYDYGYVSVSEDGRAWTLLGGEGADARNPAGAALGIGYTGESGGWTEERVDLSKYAGGRLWLRFEAVSDRAISGEGWAIKDIAVLGDALGGEFAAVGFRGAGDVDARLLARLIVWDDEGAARRIDPVIERDGERVALSFGEYISGRAALIVGALSLDSQADMGYSADFRWRGDD